VVPAAVGMFHVSREGLLTRQLRTYRRAGSEVSHVPIPDSCVASCSVHRLRGSVFGLWRVFLRTDRTAACNYRSNNRQTISAEQVAYEKIGDN
jgi:hypothetical protein